MRSSRVAAAALVCALALLAACGGRPASLDSGVRSDDAGLSAGDDLFLVQFEDEADLSGIDHDRDWDGRGQEVVDRLRATAEASQAEAIAAAEAAGARYASLWISNSLVFLGHPDLGPELAELPGVAKVWQEEVPALDDPGIDGPPTPDPGTGGWELDALQVRRLWDQGLTGEGVTIGVVDTGVDPAHPALADGYRGAVTGSDDHNWWSPLRAYREGPVDLADHGTQVAGLAVGDEVGVAPGATWIAGIGCSADGCPLSGVVHALQFMLAPTTLDERDPRPDLRPQIVNASWVRAEEDEPLKRASRAMAASGILQVYAAGNTGPDCATASPVGEGRDFLSVGATTPDGDVAAFSSRGPAEGDRLAPDVVAPGGDVVTAVPGGSYVTTSGTSFAAPLVAGVAALVLQAAPDLVGHPDRVAGILRRSATPMAQGICGGPPDARQGVPNNTSGWGLVNAPRAVAEARAPS